MKNIKLDYVIAIDNTGKTLDIVVLKANELSARDSKKLKFSLDTSHFTLDQLKEFVRFTHDPTEKRDLYYSYLERGGDLFLEIDLYRSPEKLGNIAFKTESLVING